jgi:hypothetical protein
MKYSLLLKLTIAHSAPTLFVGGALYAAYARYKWLLTNRKGRIVTKLTFNGKQVELNSSFLGVKHVLINYLDRDS